MLSVYGLSEVAVVTKPCVHLIIHLGTGRIGNLLHNCVTVRFQRFAFSTEYTVRFKKKTG